MDSLAHSLGRRVAGSDALRSVIMDEVVELIGGVLFALIVAAASWPHPSNDFSMKQGFLVEFPRGLVWCWTGFAVLSAMLCVLMTIQRQNGAPAAIFFLSSAVGCIAASRMIGRYRVQGRRDEVAVTSGWAKSRTYGWESLVRIRRSYSGNAVFLCFADKRCVRVADYMDGHADAARFLLTVVPEDRLDDEARSLLGRWSER